ncbi:PAS domain-containing protein, partial [Escherichia coli]|nr:PAS domain-containing protein [Escherichia coli]
MRPLLVTAEPLVADQGQIMGVICTARDLTELREAQAAARQQPTILVSVLQSAREAIYAVDVEGRLLWCNRAIFELTGCAPPEL